MNPRIPALLSYWCLLQVVNTVTSNQECVSNIAESLVLSNLLVLLHSLPSSKKTQLTVILFVFPLLPIPVMHLHTSILLCVLQAGRWCWKPSMHSRLTQRSSKRQWPKVSVLLFVCFCCCLFFSDCWLRLSEF